MYARLAAAALAILLLLASCTLGAEEAPGFPSYLQASRELPGEITVPPCFSAQGNYGLVASADTLYHLELRHGRVHGRTSAEGLITGLGVGTDGDIFLAAGNTVSRIQGFETAGSVNLGSAVLFLACCGDDPAAYLEDGRTVLLSGDDLSLLAETVPGMAAVTSFAGFPSFICMGAADGQMLSLTVPDLRENALETVNGPVQFMSSAGDDALLFSSEQWNEVAVCSPEDLRIHTMFTFPVTPSYAHGDSALAFIFAVCPGEGIQVCSASGEIVWRGSGYGSGSMVRLANDLETALITWGGGVDILVR